ncbi:hypothetical protein C8R44DRAFT_3321 [Mycena epipterygia]|nr:hypothetical protein C8R44DRAFT_3321 [Mycena epipterygia]
MALCSPRISLSFGAVPLPMGLLVSPTYFETRWSSPQVLRSSSEACRSYAKARWSVFRGSWSQPPLDLAVDFRHRVVLLHPRRQLRPDRPIVLVYLVAFYVLPIFTSIDAFFFCCLYPFFWTQEASNAVNLVRLILLHPHVLLDFAPDIDVSLRVMSPSSCTLDGYYTRVSWIHGRRTVPVTRTTIRSRFYLLLLDSYSVYGLYDCITTLWFIVFFT